MTPNQTLIMRLLKKQRMTAFDLAEELRISHHSVNYNLRLLRARGEHIQICAWETTRARHRPVYRLNERCLKDVPEPKKLTASEYSARSYKRHRARTLTRIKHKRTGEKSTPWSVIIDHSRANS